MFLTFHGEDAFTISSFKNRVSLIYSLQFHTMYLDYYIHPSFLQEPPPSMSFPCFFFSFFVTHGVYLVLAAGMLAALGPAAVPCQETGLQCSSQPPGLHSFCPLRGCSPSLVGTVGWMSQLGLSTQQSLYSTYFDQA